MPVKTFCERYVHECVCVCVCVFVHTRVFWSACVRVGVCVRLTRPVPAEAHARCGGARRQVDGEQRDHEGREVRQQVRRVRRDGQAVREHPACNGSEAEGPQALQAERTQSVEAKIVTLNDVSFGLLWNLNTNHLDFQKANVSSKEMKAKEICPLSFFAFHFVKICQNLKVQTKCLHQS